MLQPSDIAGICKTGQALSLFDAGDRTLTTTLGDLVEAVKADRGLTAVEQKQLLQQIATAVGPAKPLSTPISSLMFSGLGGILGYLISKYFGMGLAGRAVSAMAGFGLGRALYGKINAKPDPYKGYRSIG